MPRTSILAVRTWATWRKAAPANCRRAADAARPRRWSAHPVNSPTTRERPSPPTLAAPRPKLHLCRKDTIQAVLCRRPRSRLPESFRNSFTRHAGPSPRSETLFQTRKGCRHLRTFPSTHGLFSRSKKGRTTTLADPHNEVWHACRKDTKVSGQGCVPAVHGL